MNNAKLEQHVYRDGYGRTELDRPFYIVVCDTCHIALNSGHHYRESHKHHAEALAATHTCEDRRQTSQPA
jgi:hypothetical protein